MEGDASPDAADVVPAAPSAWPPDYVVRRSRRARRPSVSVDARRGLVVTLPQRAAARRAPEVVDELRGWIVPRLQRWQRERATLARRRASGRLIVLDEDLALAPQAGRRRVHRDGDVLRVPADTDERAAALERWCRALAREEGGRRLDEAQARIGVRAARLRVADQRTRWGSCSSTGTISLSWRLVLAPERCLDYVVWHEACHLVHPDHSPRFWALLAEHRPGWRAERAWLREHGAGLAL